MSQPSLLLRPDPRISPALPDFPVYWLYRSSLPYDLVWAARETFPTLSRPTFSTCRYPCAGGNDGCLCPVPSPSSMAFTHGLRAGLPHISGAGFTAGHITTHQYSLHATACRVARLSTRSRHYYGVRGFYIRAFPTSGHPKVKSDITTQPTGLLLWWDSHPLAECFYELHGPPDVKLLLSVLHKELISFSQILSI